MRHNQNGRRFRGGRNNSGSSHQGGSGNSSSHHHNNHSSSNNHVRRGNPRVQTFDSNGPDVRIRGNAFQVNEKYLTLARDAQSAGDRVLAESYFQHAEHYQRIINEIAEEYGQQPFQQHQQSQQAQQGQPFPADAAQPVVTPVGGNTQTQDTSMNDLDQSFLVGPRHGNGAGDQSQAVQAADTSQPQATVQHRNVSRHKEPESV